LRLVEIGREDAEDVLDKSALYVRERR